MQQPQTQTVARVLAPSKMTRLAYVDWMRGLACVLMFQTHCYDSWLSAAARKSSSLIVWSQLGGTLPAPLFIFLSGVSFALVTERLREKGVPSATKEGVRGDEIVEVKVTVPMPRDEKTKELLRELAKLNPEDPRAELFKNL